MQATDSPLSPPPRRYADLAGWLRLQQVDGVGAVAARALLLRFGNPGAIFSASFATLCEVVTAAQAAALLAPAPSPALAAQLDATLAWLQTPGHAVLTQDDPAYPANLLEIPDPPVLLYLMGRTELLSRPSLAVVGSRNASAQGLANAAAFSRALSDAGLAIVSGLALGIDAAAHLGGLAGAASSIAVIGTGADIVYPRRNHALAHLLAERGCIISEYSPGTPANRANFPRRNRLISGLARGVLVIEAAAQSGSLITARLAADQGREVFAIPGSIHATLAKGCHALIKQGAKLVETTDDVLLELNLRPRPAAPAAAAAQRAVGDVLLAALGHDPADVDMLAQRSGLDAASVIGRLLSLELAGLVERLPGGQFQRTDL
ncbi:MAG TPA: DNA-processing protein DprA [Janthinobacterium sp.]|nr:DNA-processing protein DprA [Janthinobacterium sp.]